MTPIFANIDIMLKLVLYTAIIYLKFCVMNILIIDLIWTSFSSFHNWLKARLFSDQEPLNHGESLETTKISIHSHVNAGRTDGAAPRTGAGDWIPGERNCHSEVLSQVQVREENYVSQKVIIVIIFKIMSVLSWFTYCKCVNVNRINSQLSTDCSACPL